MDVPAAAETDPDDELTADAEQGVIRVRVPQRVERDDAVRHQHGEVLRAASAGMCDLLARGFTTGLSTNRLRRLARLAQRTLARGRDHVGAGILLRDARRVGVGHRVSGSPNEALDHDVHPSRERRDRVDRARDLLMQLLVGLLQRLQGAHDLREVDRTVGRPRREERLPRARARGRKLLVFAGHAQRAQRDVMRLDGRGERRATLVGRTRRAARRERVVANEHAVSARNVERAQPVGRPMRRGRERERPGRTAAATPTLVGRDGAVRQHAGRERRRAASRTAPGATARGGAFADPTDLRHRGRVDRRARLERAALRDHVGDRDGVHRLAFLGVRVDVRITGREAGGERI